MCESKTSPDWLSARTQPSYVLCQHSDFIGVSPFPAAALRRRVRVAPRDPHFDREECFLCLRGKVKLGQIVRRPIRGEVTNMQM